MKQILVALVLMTFAVGQSQIKKIEPPFWWEGMKMPKLQLMLYGEDIAKYEIDIPGVVVSKQLRTANPNYLFLDMQTQGLKAGEYPIHLKEKGRIVQKLTYQLKKRKEGSALRIGFDSSDAVYLLMPDRFANGNPDNDTVKELSEKADRGLQGGRHGGDIQGVIDHLDHIQNLGMTAIWSTPLLEDNDTAYSYHTYAQSDVYRIDPRYGSNADYKRLADALHKRGMKLIMDYVTNHWGKEHWMIQDLPTYDWIHQFPGYANSNYRMTTQYDPNASALDKKYCEDGWFVPTMPDLNQRNPLVLQYLVQNAIWWIEYAGLDGFRVDTYSYNDKTAIAHWTKAIMHEYPHFNIMGEVWLHDQAQIAYWQKDSQIGALQSFNSYCPTVMDFTLHDAMGVVFKETSATWDQGMIKVYENMVNDFLYPDVNKLLIFAENHDTARFNQIFPNIKDYTLAMTLLATHRGIPQLYYGSEIGMAGDKAQGDGDIRRDFPGGWASDPINAFDPASRTQSQKEYFDITAKLFNWRKDKGVIHTGKTMQFIPDNNVFVYFRYSDSETVMVVLNNSTNNQELDMQRFNERIQGFSQAFDVIGGTEVRLGAKLNIGAKSALVLDLLGNRD